VDVLPFYRAFYVAFTTFLLLFTTLRSRLPTTTRFLRSLYGCSSTFITACSFTVCCVTFYALRFGCYVVTFHVVVVRPFTVFPLHHVRFTLLRSGVAVLHTLFSCYRCDYHTLPFRVAFRCFTVCYRWCERSYVGCSPFPCLPLGAGYRLPFVGYPLPLLTFTRDYVTVTVDSFVILRVRSLRLPGCTFWLPLRCRVAVRCSLRLLRLPLRWLPVPHTAWLRRFHVAVSFVLRVGYLPAFCVLIGYPLFLPLCRYGSAAFPAFGCVTFTLRLVRVCSCVAVRSF